MSNNDNEKRSIALFFRLLEERGFFAGTQTFTDMHRLLSVFPELLPGNKNTMSTAQRLRLRNMLATLFAKSPEKQKEFYSLFDDYFPLWDTAEVSHGNDDTTALHAGTTGTAAPPAPEQPVINSRAWLLVGAAVVMLLVAATFYAGQQGWLNQWLPDTEETAENDLPPEEGGIPTEQNPDSGKQTNGNDTPAPAETDTTAPATETQPPAVPEAAETDKPQRVVVEERNDFRPGTIDDMAVRPTFWQENGTALLFAALALLLAGLALYELYMYRRKQLAARRKQGQRPPFVVPIEFDSQPPIALDQSFLAAMPGFRKRIKEQSQRIDPKATAQASARQGGALHIRYKQSSRPPEYLAIIDQSSQHNHRSGLFEYMVQSMQKEGVYVERLYFDGDPTILHSERFPEGIFADEIYKHFADSRLLVFATAHRLLNPVSGMPARAAQIFGRWSSRVLFTPTPAAEWGSPEQRITSLFTLVPAGTKGMAALARLYTENKQAPFLLPEGAFNDAVHTIDIDAPDDPTAIAPRPEAMPLLTENFTPQQIKWIAACALYPEVFWDLTLYIGRALSTDENNLLTVQNISQLARLNWFRDGFIPQQFRHELLFEHHILNPQERRSVAEALHRLLLKNVPKNRQSAAYEKHRMNLAITELLLSRNERQRMRYAQKLKETAETTAQTDYTALALLEESRLTRLDFLLPATLKKHFRRGTLPYNGYMTLMRTAAVIIIALLIGWAHRQLPPPCPRHATYTTDTTTYCLATAADTARMLNRHACMIARQQPPQQPLMPLYAKASTQHIPLFEAAIEKDTNLTIAAHNLRIAQWNSYVQLYNSQQYDTLLATTDSIPPTTDSSQRWQLYNLRGLALYYTGNCDSANYYAQLLPADFFDAAPENNLLALATLCSNQSEEQLFEQIMARPGPALIRAYLEKYPRGRYRQQADSLMAGIQAEENAFETAQTTNTIPAYETYLQQYPQGSYSERAQQAIDLLTERNDENDFMLAKQINTSKAYRDYLQEHPNGQYTQQANLQIEQIEEQNAWENITTCDEIERYAQNYPNGQYINQIEQKKEQLNCNADTAAIPTPEMVFVPGGTFEMGQPDPDIGGEGWSDNEQPVHTVTVSDFYMGKYEVTNQQFAAFIFDYGSDKVKSGEYAGQEMIYEHQWGFASTDPTGFENPAGLINEGYENHPVVYVTWYGANEYCHWLSQKTGKTYRLPTEAEWEYAAGGGANNRTKWAGTNNGTTRGHAPLTDYAWYSENSGSRTHEVGTRTKNQLGLYDMSGNVWEWCLDWYDEDYYQELADSDEYKRNKRVLNPLSRNNSSGLRVLRGGSWYSYANGSRVADRVRFIPYSRVNYIGFRVVVEL